jgi:hypothetical protein
MAMLKHLKLILLIFTLSGCATQTRLGVALDMFSVSKQTQGCYDNLKKNPKFALLHKKLAVDTGVNPTISQLSDNQTPNPEMIQLGMEWFEQNQACNQQTLETWFNYDPEFGAKVSNWLTEVASIFNDTISNHLTYGEINTRIQSLNAMKKMDIKTYLEEQTRRRQSQMYAALSEEIATRIINGAVQRLQARQENIFNNQLLYMKASPSYHPIQITKNSCGFVDSKVKCSSLEIRK